MIHLQALFGVVAISFTPILVRLASVSPTTAAFYRTAAALPFLYLIHVGWDRGDPLPAVRPRALMAGGLFAVDLILFHTTIGYIGAGLATVLGNTQVLFVGLAAWLLHGERPSRTSFLVVPVVFLGVILVSGLGEPEAYGAAPIAGTLTGVGTALAYAGYLLVFRSANTAGEASSGPLLQTTASTAFCTLLFGMTLEPSFTLLVPPGKTLAWLVSLALMGQVLGWIFIGRALPRLPALETSVLLLLQPLLSVVWGWLIYQEYLSLLQGTGCLLILGGMVLLHLRGSMHSPEP